jgi:hypothetical protein
MYVFWYKYGSAEGARDKRRQVSPPEAWLPRECATALTAAELPDVFCLRNWKAIAR